MKRLNIGGFEIGGGGLSFIMGPCVMESEKIVFETLEGLLKITESVKAPFLFKSSYDKANRTSVDSFRGPGMDEGLKLLKRVRDEYEVPVLTDVHSVEEARGAAEVVDVVQIPAFLCRQTDLIVEAARAAKAVNIKKGQFLAPEDMGRSVDKALSAGNENIILTERGTSFGYHDLVVDFRGLPVMRSLGYPVVFDATHSVQKPSGRGGVSGGDRAMARVLARAAVAVGVDGVFMEVHPEPDSALCDGPNSIALSDVEGILTELLEVAAASPREASGA